MIFVLLLLLTACQQQPHITTFEGQAMTMDYAVKVGGALSPQQQEHVLSILRETFHEVNERYNKWNPVSEVSQLNRANGHEKIPLTPDLEAFLDEVDRIVALSDGRFDPTIEPLKALWKEQVPTHNQLAEIAPAIGWKHFHVERGTFWKEDDRLQMDLGGIAKGLCIDLIVERLRNAGFGDVYVEWGGEIRAQGQHPSGRPWKVFTSNGDQVIALHNEAVATSGNAFQRWEINGVVYTHIFDPVSLKPLTVDGTGIESVSVVAPTCVLADGLATTAMLFPTLEEARTWATKVERELLGVRFYFFERIEGQKFR